MDDIKNSLPLFKKIDQTIFQSIDKFKLTTNYTLLQDFYNGLEEEQQKVFKAFVILALFIIPISFLSFLYWQNNTLKADLNMRVSMVEKSNEIIGQRQGMREVAPQILSLSPIDSSEMMTSRLSNLISSLGVDLSKIRVSDFNTTMISDSTMKSEAEFAFNNFSTDELMNTLIGMIQNEKFRIQSISIKRGPESNLLVGQFHAIHYSAFTPEVEGAQ